MQTEALVVLFGVVLALLGGFLAGRRRLPSLPTVARPVAADKAEHDRVEAARAEATKGAEVINGVGHAQDPNERRRKLAELSKRRRTHP